MLWPGTSTQRPLMSNFRPWYPHIRYSPDNSPFDNGAARWQQQSSSAATLPDALRNSTTLSLRNVRPTGRSLRSLDQIAAYQPFRRNMHDLQHHGTIGVALGPEC